jgi:hypothetical protein
MRQLLLMLRGYSPPVSVHACSDALRSNYHADITC